MRAKRIYTDVFPPFAPASIYLVLSVSPFSDFSECAPVDFTGSMGLRIGAIFIIGFSSLGTTLFPIVARRSPHVHIPKAAFDFAKYAGSGTSFILFSSFLEKEGESNEIYLFSCTVLPTRKA